MKRILILATVAVLTVGAFSTVSASNDDHERRDIKAKLSGLEEVLPISTTGSGRLRLSVDEVAQTIAYELSYTGLEGGAVTGAHLHFGQRGVGNGGIIANLCIGTCPSPITGTINAAGIVGPATQGIAAGEFQAALAAIRAGAVYVNIHTIGYPAGEIRGQLKGGKS